MPKIVSRCQNSIPALNFKGSKRLLELSTHALSIWLIVHCNIVTITIVTVVSLFERIETCVGPTNRPTDRPTDLATYSAAFRS